MNKEQKNQVIDSLTVMLKENPHFYLTDTSGLTVEKTSKLRRMCFEKDVKMLVVKNTLLSKAMEKTGNPVYEPFHDTLKGTTAIKFSAVANTQPKTMKKSRAGGNNKPILNSFMIFAGV